MEQLKVEGISKSFDGEPVLADISITLNKGELVSLLGISGGGKTTLFNIIAGLSRPDTGHVLLDGEDVTGCPGRVSYMLQKDLLLPYRTIEDNVALPLIVKGMKKREAREAVFPYFRQFGLEGTQKKYPAEPFSALDMLTKKSVHDWYLKVMDEIHLSTLFITHDIDEAILLSDRIYLLTGRPGRITEELIIKETKPRDRDFGLTEEFLEYKRHILRHLETTV